VALKDKVRVLMNAVYKSGIAVFQDKQVIADAQITNPNADGIRVVTLRFAAPAGVAEQILHSFKTGEVEVLMGEVAPAEA
jgi:hypothetical protein